MKRVLTFGVGILTIAVPFVIVAVVTWYSKPCSVDVRYETFSKLKIGMSKKDIEAILGGPAGNYSTVIEGSLAGTLEPTFDASDQVSRREWHTDEYEITVYFDPDGKAKWIGGGRVSPLLPSMRYPPPLRQIMHHVVDP